MAVNMARSVGQGVGRGKGSRQERLHADGNTQSYTGGGLGTDVWAGRAGKAGGVRATGPGSGRKVREG